MRETGNGKLVISLDFELLYGMNDSTKIERWKRNAAGARKAIPQMLALFEKYDIHVTWGIVGMLFHKNKQEWEEGKPQKLPQYEEKRFSSYTLTLPGENEEEDPFHYGASLISKIRETPHQEIGSHTYSHYYCMEKGQTKDTFCEDVKAAKKVSERNQDTFQSFIFPKNQFREEYLEVLKAYGIQVVRGNEKGSIYRASAAGESLLKRGLRLADSYCNISGYHCYRKRELTYTAGVLNLPSSRFLRPYSEKLRILEGCKISRIRGQMRHAAKNGEIFHLWWHPHNFGSHTKENLQNLENLLKYYQSLQEKYHMESATMGEIADEMPV